MRKKKVIRFTIETIEDLQSNDVQIDNFFQYLSGLINENREIEFYRIGGEDKLTRIKDLNHLDNFKYSFGFIKR